MFYDLAIYIKRGEPFATYFGTCLFVVVEFPVCDVMKECGKFYDKKVYVFIFAYAECVPAYSVDMIPVMPRTFSVKCPFDELFSFLMSMEGLVFLALLVLLIRQEPKLSKLCSYVKQQALK